MVRIGQSAGSRGVAVRPATPDDRAAVGALAAGLAQSFPFSPAAFDRTFATTVRMEHACVLVALDGTDVIGYLLGFAHPTFYANGPTALVEEIFVDPAGRRGGTGRALMTAFEGWAAGRGCALVALATRRARDFYLTLGYQESATYLRRILPA